ncbi:MAG: hypothetical protein US50_C0016G0012 [Candidatus Nomurabacteria bacterium GW2011_GWB1_37_5]|uniref:Uncharacterized protein n=1 Tax=Candidatus Nomurabacteria bacterium GW2011_GWB1_37_5 TaxID=1618742 RepID=A0A0G0GZD0_9BACT|nr:MAG: hypothetical protein US50_C0016G0012 [Candidatus Nomurabacteria bacterium GW2011_GWB1_37_5]
METNIKRILIVSFSNKTSQVFFCAKDKKRIVFFTRLLIGELPSMTSKTTTITVYRNGVEIDSCKIYLSGGHVESLQFLGLEKLRIEKNVPKREWANGQLYSFHFNEGDILELDKEYRDFEKPDEWLDEISVRRKYGADFATVFGKEKDFIEKMTTFFSCSLEELQSKKIIFTNNPVDTDFTEFY